MSAVILDAKSLVSLTLAQSGLTIVNYIEVSVLLTNMYMLSGCEFNDTENIGLPSQNMEFAGE
jgi:hypothetical protein